MAFDPLTWTFNSSETAQAAGVSRMTFDAWVLRKYLPLPPGPGTGRSRQFSYLDVVAIAAVAELVNLGINIGIAAHAATLVHRLRDDGHDLRIDEPGWTLILVSSAAPKPPDNRPWPMPGALLKPDSFDQLHTFIKEKFGGPTSFVFLDFSRLVEQVENRIYEGALAARRARLATVDAGVKQIMNATDDIPGKRKA